MSKRFKVEYLDLLKVPPSGLDEKAFTLQEPFLNVVGFESMERSFRDEIFPEKQHIPLPVMHEIWIKACKPKVAESKSTFKFGSEVSNQPLIGGLLMALRQLTSKLPTDEPQDLGKFKATDVNVLQEGEGSSSVSSSTESFEAEKEVAIKGVGTWKIDWVVSRRLKSKPNKSVFKAIIESKSTLQLSAPRLTVSYQLLRYLCTCYKKNREQMYYGTILGVVTDADHYSMAVIKYQGVVLINASGNIEKFYSAEKEGELDTLGDDVKEKALERVQTELLDKNAQIAEGVYLVGTCYVSRVSMFMPVAEILMESCPLPSIQAFVCLEQLVLRCVDSKAYKWTPGTSQQKGTVEQKLDVWNAKMKALVDNQIRGGLDDETRWNKAYAGYL